MTRLKHILILIILVFPMFALAPSLIARPNEVLSNPTEVDIALPAQFAQESLRVAVFAEDNTTLPAYASGGTYTDHYMNVINLLESAGCTVTALSTQDILDHKLMVADYDVFVLPNQGPKESIINLVKDYWLGGGGILNFAQSVGFCFYAGIIDPIYEGSDQLGPEWMWLTAFPNITIEDRHPVTKAYDTGDRFVQPGNVTFFNPDMATTTSDRFIPLGVNDIDPSAWNIFALDNPNRGGKFVHLPGNCSVISSWLEPIIIDAVDWLAPRPKGRILYDLTHTPVYGVDSWDVSLVQSSVTQTEMRAMLVNRSYTFDKLYPSSTLSSQNLDGYDILVICDPLTNFTANEVAEVTDWVSDGGSILAISDHTLSKNQNMNYLLSNMDIAMNHSATGTNALVQSDVHVTHEGCVTMSCLAPGAVGTAGSAFSIWEDAVGVPVIGGDEHGNGRVILIADGAIMRDGRISITDNAQALINFVNWLSAAKASILVYADTNTNPLHPNIVPLNGPVAKALCDLGEPFYMTSDISFFNLSLYNDNWDLVVFDNNMYNTLDYQPHLIDFVEDGGKVIFNTWDLDSTTGTYFGVDVVSYYSAPPSVFLWELDHPIFNKPATYSATTINTTLNIYGTEALNVTTYANATPLAGYGDSGVAIAIGAGGKVIFNGPTFVIYNEDTDNSTYPDNVELWTNQIGFLFYDRPMIDHPDDVGYMETETGNEIIWTPIADAGPWEYVVKENGSIVEVGHWGGGIITINVDGVSTSSTEYELTVFDKLGYSVSDMVVLVVTEYIEPDPTTTTETNTTSVGEPLDPMLLIIIAAGGGAVVIIIIIVMLRGKKK